ncbi:MAG: hypothetical protein WD557_03435 [Dehalococcoidia bacterium]
MSTVTRSSYAPTASARWEPARVAASLESSQAARSASDSLCRPLTAEELRIIRGGIPEEDFIPAA